jgi:hypothetical protein
MTDAIKFELAEVIGINGTLQYIEPDQNQTGNADQLFSIQVQTVNRYTRKRDIRTVRPANMNDLQIPLIGEHVLIFRAYNQETTLSNTGIQWYYLKPYAIQSNINANLVPGISYRDIITETEAQSIKSGIDFKTTSVSPLQPYEGDIIYQGRWGNTIRLGSTVKNVDSLIAPTWQGERDVDPLIIISNGQRNLENKRFVVENIQEDPASIYLTTSQKIPSFKLNNNLSNASSESEYNKPQIIASADRITLRAKTDHVILDSQTGIEINSPKIFLGSSENKEPMLHTEAVVEILQKIIDTIQIGFVDAGGKISTPIYNGLQDASTLLKQIKNFNIMIDKYKV